MSSLSHLTGSIFCRLGINVLLLGLPVQNGIVKLLQSALNTRDGLLAYLVHGQTDHLDEALRKEIPRNEKRIYMSSS